MCVIGRTNTGMKMLKIAFLGVGGNTFFISAIRKATNDQRSRGMSV